MKEEKDWPTQLTEEGLELYRAAVEIEDQKALTAYVNELSPEQMEQFSLATRHINDQLERVTRAIGCVTLGNLRGDPESQYLMLTLLPSREAARLAEDYLGLLPHDEVMRFISGYRAYREKESA